MRKILLIAIALIAIMGTASAADVDIAPSSGDNPLYHPLDGTAVSYDVEINGMVTPLGVRYIQITNYDLDTVTLTGPGITGLVTLTATAGQTVSTTWTPTSSNQMFTLDVTTYNIGAVNIKTNVGTTLKDDAYEDDAAVGSNQFDIPEFPTIALPIAAILGLAFIFQRRREEE